MAETVHLETGQKGSDDKEAKLEEQPGDIVTRWLRELDAADRHEKPWRTRSDKIVCLYKDERAAAEQGSGEYRFNILFANTEVLKGALYSQCPVPDIRRRFLDKDPVGRVAALVLTRATATAMDLYDFDGMMKDAVNDRALVGRGVSRVKYVPTIQKSEQRAAVDAPAEGAVPPDDVQQDEQGYFRMESVEEVTNEAVECCYVEWDMFRYSPTKRWSKVRWVAYGDLLTRDDCVREFGEEIGQKVELKWMPKGVEDNEENAILKRALVWTIYNRTKKEMVCVSDGYKDAPLKVEQDPLRLESFFPTCRPLYGIHTTNSLIPTPDYVVYQDHARQLDELNERIAVITDAIRHCGVYDSSQPELAELAKASDNKFVPVKSWREFVEKGGLEQAIQTRDISMLAKVLVELMNQAEVKKQQIYEVLGISDIMRGATKASETLGAQKIKDQWGSVRVGPSQGEVQRFARDNVRLIAEVIAEHFSPQTLAQMTGVQLAMNDAEKQAISAVDPKDPRLKRPTWEAVLQVLRSDRLRGFKIDIETDSTIKPQADDEQKNRVEAITSLTGFFEKTLPAVQQGIVPQKVVTELASFGLRAFKAGPQLEEILEEWEGGLDEQPEQQNPAQALQQQEAQEQQAHARRLREIEAQTATANMVKAKAQAYAELAKAEGVEPGVQLDLLTRQAKLAGILDPASAPAGETIQ